MVRTRDPEPEPASVWVYRGPDRIYAQPPIQVTDGDALAWPERPFDDGCWSEAEPETEPTVQTGVPHRIWTEEELTHGPVPALKEHWEQADAEAAAAMEVSDNG